ncbi:MAG: hypothetical protein K0S34_513 [Bacillales bacterium]|jgi:hypothetical protein|nr:hypothetical protein [Bacillales bacterium]
MDRMLYPVLFGILFGVISRVYMMRTDYRQYPSYLHGKTVHLALGFIASCLGSVIAPAIIDQDYTAVTFFTLAASQFRDVRNMERNTLSELDSFEIVPRGKTYIEGIALVFEGRNYLVIVTSFITTLAYIKFNVWVALAAGIVCIILSSFLMSGRKIRDIADIRPIELRFDDAGLYVGNVYMMNVGVNARKEDIERWGKGFILIPKNLNASVCLTNLGQRQAILHDCSSALGIYKDSGNPALTPLAKRDLETGEIAIFILPREQDTERAIQVIGNVPTLESSYRDSKKRLQILRWKKGN